VDLAKGSAIGYRGEINFPIPINRIEKGMGKDHPYTQKKEREIIL